MAEVQIAKMRPKHQALAQFMLANPTCTNNDIARAFEMTATWVSVIVNSQAFAEYMALLNEELLHAQVIPLRDKLMGVSHLAVEKLGEAVSVSHDPKFLLDVADKTLHRLGYAPSRGPEPATQVTNIQQNVYTVDKALLAEARAAMLAQAQGPLAHPQEKIINGVEADASINTNTNELEEQSDALKVSPTKTV